MSERSSQAELMSRKREKDRDIVIEPVKDPQRRLRACSDPFLFLETYFPDRFYDSWNDDRRLMIDQIRYRARYGGDKAIAAPRGEGKTTLAECEVGVDAIVQGMLKYPVIIAASGPMAENILDNIKIEYENNDLLIEDFPEVCGPVVALEGANQRAKMQTYRGEQTRMKWSKGAIVFPTIKLAWCPKCFYPEPKQRSKRCKTEFECPKCGERYNEWKSAASGSMIDARGMDGSFRGLRKGSQRPDFVLIDDPETEESARSAKQIEDRERTIDNAIGGLGTTRKPVARLMLTTIQNNQCLSAKYTDRHQKPSWDGDRLAIVRRWPERKDLWEKYMEIRKTGMQEEVPDKHGRKAHEFFVDNFEEMVAGCIVSNPDRYDNSVLEDGSQKEIHTIQHIHNAACDKSWDYVFNELQNDPQELDEDNVLQMSVGIVTGTHSSYRERLNGLDAGVIPEGTKYVTAFIDVQHDRLYYEVVAWMRGQQRSIVDYGHYGSDIGRGLTIQDATIERIVSLHNYWKHTPYTLKVGESGKVPDITLVDSGDGVLTTSIYSACLQTGFVPSKGTHRFNKPKADTSNRGPDAWHATRIRHEKSYVGLLVFSVEPFRHRCRDSWLEEPSETKPGSVFIFGENPNYHRPFGEHLSVTYDRSWDEKKGWREAWLEPRRHDWWDCDYGNLVAYSVLLESEERRRTSPKRRYGVLSKK